MTSGVWRVVGSSVRGAAHARRGVGNQDAIAWVPESGVGLPLAVAASDGHGNAISFRSAEGARRAVTTATTVLREVLGGLTGRGEDGASVRERLAADVARRWQRAVESYRRTRPDLADELASLRCEMEETAATRSEDAVSGPVAVALAALVSERWKDSIRADLLRRPFSRAEIVLLRRAAGDGAADAVRAEPLLAYGATLLAVLVTEACAVYLQLGDGDILSVSEAGEVRRPLPKDEKLFANETTSLCLDDAWRHVRVRVDALDQGPPPLIVVATDGYPNSFRDEKGFLKVGSDLLAMIRSEGLQAVRDSLPGWLRETSRFGSGDDITVGLICRAPARTGASR